MVRFGVTTFPTDYGLSVVELARAVEGRGLDSIFLNEHTHIPVSRHTAFPGGGELPKNTRTLMTLSWRLQRRALCERAGRSFDSLELAVIGLPPSEDFAKRLLKIGLRHLIFGLRWQC